MATDDALLQLRDVMREHRRTLAGPAFDIEALIRAVDTLLEVQEMRLEEMVKRLIRARQRDARLQRGAAGVKRRRKPVH